MRPSPLVDGQWRRDFRLNRLADITAPGGNYETGRKRRIETEDLGESIAWISLGAASPRGQGHKNAYRNQAHE